MSKTTGGGASRSKPYPRTRRERVSATEAAKNLGRLVDRVREERATWTIERGGVAVAEIGPVRRAGFGMVDFKALIDSLPKAGDEYLDAVDEARRRRNTPRARRDPWAR